MLVKTSATSISSCHWCKVLIRWLNAESCFQGKDILSLNLTPQLLIKFDGQTFYFFSFNTSRRTHHANEQNLSKTLMHALVTTQEHKIIVIVRGVLSTTDSAICQLSRVLCSFIHRSFASGENHEEYLLYETDSSLETLSLIFFIFFVSNNQAFGIISFLEKHRYPLIQA